MILCEITGNMNVETKEEGKRLGEWVRIQSIEVGREAYLEYVKRDGVLVTSEVEWVSIEEDRILMNTENTHYCLEVL